MDIDSWKSQLRKGAAELAVLALLEKNELSGIGLLDSLGALPEIGISDGAIYPLLNRLERERRVAGQWRTPSGGGRGQKVYRLTPQGADALSDMRGAWNGFRDQLSTLVGE